MIERRSVLPLYYQVQEYLRQQIDTGAWKPGDQILTERQLCELFGVSRITIVKALTRLVEEGYLVREQGKGTFVAYRPLIISPPRLRSFTEDMAQRGLKAGSRILSYGVQPCPAHVRTILELPDGDADLVWVVERLRTANGEPMGLQRAYLPYARFSELGSLLADDVSLYQILAQHYQAHPVRAVETYSAVALSDAEAALLKQVSGCPAFAVERTTWASDGAIIEYVRSVMRSDKYHYSVELQRTQS